MTASYILDPYDNLLDEILQKGVRKSNRTGVDTIALFGTSSRFIIEKYFPLLTRRKVWPKAIFSELLWFISGSTNNKDLQALGSNIWTPWVNEEFEKKHGYEEGSLGPVYGYQLRNFGGDYPEKNGFDQLSYLINEIKTNPNSRRLMFSLWNPNDLSKSRLPPCHFNYCVFIHENKLSGLLTQRSADVAIGSCANIQFYSALTYMIAQQTGYTPYELVYNIYDAHIYVNQIDAVKEYLSRRSPSSPCLHLRKAEDIFSYRLEDFEVLDYSPLESIKIAVAV